MLMASSVDGIVRALNMLVFCGATAGTAYLGLYMEIDMGMHSNM